MSISASLNNALTGLTANARAAELVSNNVANATNPSYARRELQLGARVVGDVGQGVAVLGVERMVDRALLSDRRIADAGAAGREAVLRFHADLEAVVGLAGEAGAITGRIAALETALIEAASRPDSEARLANVGAALRDVTGAFSTASGRVQEARLRADQTIAAEVGQLNDALARVQDLNVLIRSARSSGNDPTGLMDQRQQAIDMISRIVPLRELQRDHDQVALITAGGATLLDGKASVFGFAGVNTITPDMTLASGALSGLTLNGRPVALGQPPGAVDGGTLAAQFAIRDTLGVAAQASLDATARNLIERFQDPTLDATRAPGAAGLLTDAGSAFAAINEQGLSARLRVNAAVDPAQGGAPWRLRDGLGAAVQGPPGNGQLLAALHDAMTAARPTASGPFASGPRSLAVLAADLASLTTAARINAETDLGFARARSDSLTELHLAQGVDTDQEMQKLLVIEQAYSANAKVVQTMDELIQILMGL
ncbi:MAG: flagellar hook-associated protein FlgK [Rhodobacteraceae bacterium]|jgi:flagellar hook-associated protein 1 FlgK|nr:flagellar hook-associated protein FlgK [Paracoccaceae bacterium]